MILFFCPAVLLLVRFVKGPRFRWWKTFVLILFVGWASTIGASYCTTNELSTEIKEYESRAEPVPDELSEDWASDSHAVFALFFGWAFAGIILCPWLILYAIAHGIRKIYRNQKGASEATTEPSCES